MFFKLDNTVYKSGNRVTIGRGAPFVQLDSDRSILRAHCRLIKKRNDFFLIKLHNRADVKVNGKEAPLLKAIKLTNSDEVILGESLKLKKLDNYTLKNYETIRRFILDPNGSKRPEWVIPFIGLSLVLFILLVLVYFIQGEGSLLVGSKIVKSLIFSALIISGIELFKRMKKDPNEIPVKEVFIGKDGVTFYLDRGNISIPFNKIKKLGKIKKQTFSVKAFKKTYLIENVKGAETLYGIIEQLMEKNEIKPVKKLKGRQG